MIDSARYIIDQNQDLDRYIIVMPFLKLIPSQFLAEPQKQ
jgi:hypothetical protein